MAYRQLVGSLGLPRLSYTIDSIKSLQILFIQVLNAFFKFKIIFKCIDVKF